MIRTNHSKEISKALEDIQNEAEKAAKKCAAWQVAECDYEGDKYNQYLNLLLKDAFGLLYRKYTNRVYKTGTENK